MHAVYWFDYPDYSYYWNVKIFQKLNMVYGLRNI
jgi:hypothetical protein